MLDIVLTELQGVSLPKSSETLELALHGMSWRPREVAWVGLSSLQEACVGCVPDGRHSWAHSHRLGLRWRELLEWAFASPGMIRRIT